MPLKKGYVITYGYLKQGKWKYKTTIIEENELEEYENNENYRIINKK
jgi:hypothetical protein